MKDFELRPPQFVSKYENALIKLEKENVSYFKQLDRKKEECKYDKMSYERAFKNMKEQNDHLRAQLECQKGKEMDTKPLVFLGLVPLLRVPLHLGQVKNV